MGVVPRVVIHQDRPVCHGRQLVPVVPPTHYLGVLGGVELQPVVRLPIQE